MEKCLTFTQFDFCEYQSHRKIYMLLKIHGKKKMFRNKIFYCKAPKLKPRILTHIMSFCVILILILSILIRSFDIVFTRHQQIKGSRKGIKVILNKYHYC